MVFDPGSTFFQYFPQNIFARLQTLNFRLLVMCPLLIGIFFLAQPKSHAQVPGTEDIIKEFPEFTRELQEERRELLNFEYARVISFSFYGAFDVLIGGLAQTMSNNASFLISFEYYMFAQSVIVIRAGFSEASLAVAGLEDYVDINGVLQVNQPLVYEGSVTMYPITIGYRYYFGHPAYPNFLTLIGLNAELSGGILIREESYTILQDGPNHPGLLFFKDISPIFTLTAGLEFPIVDRSIYFGLRGGFTLALLTDNALGGYVNEPRDGNWATASAYVMVHLE